MALFRLEYKHGEVWPALPLWRSNTLGSSCFYRIVFIPRNVYFPIGDTYNFSCACVQDVDSFSYWTGYAGFPFLETLNMSRWAEGVEDRDGDKANDW